MASKAGSKAAKGMNFILNQQGKQASLSNHLIKLSKALESLDMKKEARSILKIGIAMKAKTAVIILGNPKYIKGNDDAINFYKELKGYLEGLGYIVTFDKGEPHTEPPMADLWVGHSRGADRLRFAPEGVKVLGIGATTGEGYTVINHPKDSAVLGGPPNQYHFTLTEEMKDWLSGIDGMEDG